MKKEELRIELKERYSLSLLYFVLVFCILLLSIFVAVILGIFLSRSGTVDFERFSPLLFMALVSAAVGLILTLLTRKIPLNPVNTVINNMNRLKAGDFKTRICFDGILHRHPVAREVEESFNAMAQELENTEILRGDFINNFSHEFKTPIVSIAGFAKLLRRGNLSEEQKEEYLAIIEEESLRLSAMATNVLALTKIENQSILTDVSSYNLSEQIRGCVLLLEDKWSRKELEIELDFDEYSIQANEEAMKQVWINLLDNAVKFSPATGEIRVSISEEADLIKVSIFNYGEDIPSDKLDKIWNKFYQADESHSGKGNGIGLAIVKAIVELHRGKVSAESANGCTCFSVKLPK